MNTLNDLQSSVFNPETGSSEPIEVNRHSLAQPWEYMPEPDYKGRAACEDTINNLKPGQTFIQHHKIDGAYKNVLKVVNCKVSKMFELHLNSNLWCLCSTAQQVMTELDNQNFNYDLYIKG